MQSPYPVMPVAPEAASLEDISKSGELDLYAVYFLLRSHWIRIFACGAFAFLAMVAYTLKVKPRFAATTSIIIPQNNNSAAGRALQAAAGRDLGGGGNELYNDIL